jgi:hypothetical protein
MISPLEAFLDRVDDPDLEGVSPEAAERLLTLLGDELGLAVSLRDPGGEAQLLTPAAQGGGGNLTHLRFFAEDGTEIPLIRHPMHIARTSGIPIRSTVLGLNGKAGTRRWYQTSYLPLGGGAKGWSLLSVGVEVTRIVEGRRAAEERAEGLEALLLLLARSLVGASPDLGAMAATCVPFAERISPHGRMVLAMREGDALTVRTVLDRSGMDESRERLPLIGDVLEHWRSTELDVRQELRDIDIYANRVVGSLRKPFRSVVVVPVVVDGNRVASLAAVDPRPHAYSDAQIEVLARAGELLAEVFEAGRAAAA